jgi:hypothetical protein
LQKDDIRNFIINLESNKIYTLIPFVSIDCRVNDPFLTLSPQILITKNSDPLLLFNYLDDKINFAIDQFNIDRLENFYTVLKYKSVEITF